ncbi:MAG TPA: hypothetical protein VLG76_00715 [Rhabdochlamydiaceae bacterium]|nr:hypothetical protein [Rhabdochlamydiaceae bacterium]
MFVKDVKGVAHHFKAFVREISTQPRTTLPNKVWRSPVAGVTTTQRVFSKQFSETAQKVIGGISGAVGIIMLCALNERQSQEKLQYLAKMNGAILRDIDGGRASRGDV